MKPRIRHKSGFEILREAIPDHHEQIASLVGVGVSEVYRWQSPPESNDEPRATGRRSPLDRILDLISAIYLHNPEGAAIITDHLVAHLDHLRRTHRRPFWNAHQTLEDVLTGTAAVLHELSDGELTERDIKALLKLRTVLDSALDRARATYEQQQEVRQ